MSITDKFEPFLFEKKRFKGAFGGRSGTKSQTFTDILVKKVHTDRLKVGCFREHQNTIEDSVHSLITAEIDRMNVPGFRMGKTTIDHQEGGKFRFRGLSRNASGVKSFHGFDIFWVEEAQFISKNSLKMVTPTLREEDSEFWFTFNPLSRVDPIAQRFVIPFMKDLSKNGVYEDKLHYIIWTNFDENPWMPETLEEERKFDYENLSRAEYDHIWLGHFNDTIESAIIHAEWFDAAVDSHIKMGWKPCGQRIASHDPSDTGADDKSLVIRHGSLVEKAELMKTGDVNEGCEWALSRAREENADVFIWDGDGMGVGLRKQVDEGISGTNIKDEIFRGSMSPDFDQLDVKGTKNTYKNKRAQYYWHLRLRFYKTYRARVKGDYVDPDEMISISSGMENIEQLRSELCRIPRKFNGNGTIQVMSKKEMEKLKIDSPNLADALMMSMMPVDTAMGGGSGIEFDSLW